MKRREVKETLSKKFLLGLLEPFHPTMRTGEKITDFGIFYDLDNVYVNYVIMKGGVEDKELQEGNGLRRTAGSNKKTRGEEPSKA